MLDKLKNVLEGREIIAVLPGNAPESLFCLKLSDGKIYKVFGNDCGWWFHETEGTEGYSYLDNLIRDYGHHVYWLSSKYDYEDHFAKIALIDDTVTFTSPNDKVFSIPLSRLTDGELKIVNSEIGREFLAQAIEFADGWKSEFKYNSDCPEELKGLV